jgi:hypothetical protein
MDTASDVDGSLALGSSQVLASGTRTLFIAVSTREELVGPRSLKGSSGKNDREMLSSVQLYPGECALLASSVPVSMSDPIIGSAQGSAKRLRTGRLGVKTRWSSPTRLEENERTLLRRSGFGNSKNTIPSEQPLLGRGSL